MKVQYFVCAQSSALDRTTNQLSLFHILDEITGPSFPLMLPTLCVATLYQREASEPDEQSTVLAVSLSGTLVASFTLSVDFGRSRRIRSVNTINGLLLPAPGPMTISLSQRSDLLAVWSAQAIGPDRPVTPRDETSRATTDTAAPMAARRGPRLN